MRAQTPGLLDLIAGGSAPSNEVDALRRMLEEVPPQLAQWTRQMLAEGRLDVGSALKFLSFMMLMEQGAPEDLAIKY